MTVGELRNVLEQYPTDMIVTDSLSCEVTEAEEFQGRLILWSGDTMLCYEPRVWEAPRLEVEDYDVDKRFKILMGMCEDNIDYSRYLIGYLKRKGYEQPEEMTAAEVDEVILEFGSWQV